MRIPAGKFISGALILGSNLSFRLDAGAILQGSTNFKDYGTGAHRDAFLKGNALHDITIEGSGIIDGVDCRNPEGEEGFRGPHCILLIDCSNISVTGITIRRSANYAIYCISCSSTSITGVTIRGGHDGLHAFSCEKVTLTGCDFRTGDDCIAGCGSNTDFTITDCYLNCSCNAIRLGCFNLVARRLYIRGPGEYMHRYALLVNGTPRYNMLGAFIHCAYADSPLSGNWDVSDCIIDNVDAFYNYDVNGYCQAKGQVGTIRFTNLNVTNLKLPTTISGGHTRQLKMNILNSSFSFAIWKEGREHFNANVFDKLEFHNVTLRNSGAKPVLIAQAGNAVWLDRMQIAPSCAEPYILKDVNTVSREASSDTIPAPDFPLPPPVSE